MKQFLLLYIFSSLFLAATSQKKSIEYGFHGGINLNQVYKSSIGGVDNSFTGLSIGGNLKINMQKKWGLKAALFYDQNGYAYHGYTFESTISSGPGHGGVVYKLHYLNLPLMAEYVTGNKIKYYFDGGIFFGFLLKKESTLIEPPAETHTDSHPSGFNFGIALGAGIKIPLSSLVMLNIGVKNLTSLTNTYTGSSTKLNSFSVLAGLSFNSK